MRFQDFATENGVLIRELRISDRIQRCATTTHPRSKNGAYLFDGQRGWVQNWETGAPAQWWNDENAKPWTDIEKAQWEKRKRDAAAERIALQKAAATKAQALVNSARPDKHGYLRGKQLPEARGLVLPDGELLIPMRDCLTNALVGAQVIKLADNEWDKKMIYGMRAKGAVFRIGNKSSLTILCEGMATGISIDMAARMMSMDASVVVCFSASNIVHVASLLSGRVVVFADNDKSHTGQQAAIDTCRQWVMSDVEGEDANDLHDRAGLMAVCRLLMELKQEWSNAPSQGVAGKYPARG